MSDWDEFMNDIDEGRKKDHNADLRQLRKMTGKTPALRTTRGGGSRSQKKGAKAEKIALTALEKAGVLDVRKVPLLVIVTESFPVGNQTYYKIIRRKVNCDFRGILPGGRRVWAEVKARDRALRYSDLKHHQIRALNNNSDLGGLSLLVWVYERKAYVLSWPIEGFEPGRSVSIEYARGKRWKIDG